MITSFRRKKIQDIMIPLDNVEMENKNTMNLGESISNCIETMTELDIDKIYIKEKDTIIGVALAKDILNLIYKEVNSNKQF